jgi:sarcosine oxidase gamma subunit
VTRLSFLSPGECAPEVPLVSPLRHAELGPAVRDVSGLGLLEVRGAIPDGALPIGPDRGLLVVDGDVRAARERLAAEGLRVYDQTAALAAFEVEGEDVMRRLTELDLDALPTIGAVARAVPAVIERRGEGRFRLYVPQELGHYVAEVAADAAKGLGR